MGNEHVRRGSSRCYPVLVCTAIMLLFIATACGAPPPPPPPSAPTVISIAINGTVALTAVGQTSPLTATATLTDGTTQNVTNSSTWTSSSAAVATVSTAGLVTALAAGAATITATYQGRAGTLGMTVSNTPAGPGNAHRMIAWASYEKLVKFSDAQLDLWKSRGVDGFVVQTRYLDEIGGIEMWTGDSNDPLNVTIIEGADVHERQRTLRDNQFAQRCHARGLTVYLGFYLSNYHNLSTPLKVWNDDAGWAQIIPIVRGVAGAAKLLGMDGIATDSENYRSDSQTWNWKYPGVTQTETIVRSLARQRGREFMDAVLAGFPNVEIINYRLEVPGSWEEKVQQQVNHVVGIWDKSVFPDFWGGIVDAGGFSAIHFFDPIFYKSWQVGSGWEEALDYNLKGVRGTLSKRWANWDYASTRFFLSPFAWIDPGPSAGSFDDARPPDYVAAQLNAFHKWGEGNMFGLYTQHIDDFDYTPYVPAMQAASTPDAVTATSLRLEQGVDGLHEPTDAALSPVQRLVVAAGEGGVPTIRDGGLNKASAVGSMSLSSDSLRVDRVAAGLREPTDAAFTPDGRLFIAEREGRIRIVRDGSLITDPALTLDDVWSAGSSGLLAIAIDPQFERTHFVYVIYTAASRSGEPAFRLARFRDLQDTLGDRAVLLDAVPAARTGAAASLRFGPDGKLFAAFDAGGDPRWIGDRGSYNGKILRLNADGSTPSDQPVATPVFAYGYSAPRGLDWQFGTRALWVVGRDLQDVGRLRIVVPGEVRSIFRAESMAGVLPRAANPSALAFYRGDLIPSLSGDLLVAGGDEPAITRIRFESGNPVRITLMEPLLENVGGVIRTLVVSPEGAIYFCVNDELRRLVAGRSR